MDHLEAVLETPASPVTEVDKRNTANALPSPSNAPCTFRIAVLSGDGIGPEVMAEAVRVLNAVTEIFPDVRFELNELAAGAGHFLQTGVALPAETLAACEQADAILLGAMGLPNVLSSDGREVAPQIDLREKLDLYCGLRPIRLFHSADSPLKQVQGGEINLVIVRESTEGLFSTRHVLPAPTANIVDDVLRITRQGSERLFRAAFRLAQTRRQRVTLVDKANVLPSMVFFRSVFEQVAAEFPDVATEKIYVDAAALYLVQRPQAFDVIVTENMFGDILSDLAASLVGGMGLAPSADIGERAAIFQPAHGTAPDIAGRGIANPTAMILSVALMLEWLGDLRTVAAAKRIRRAVDQVMGDATKRTPDLRGSLSTRQMGDEVLLALAATKPIP